MITLHELLKDPVYKEFFCRVPQLPLNYTPEMMPWRLMVQRKGEKHWRSKRFGTYQEAFAALKKVLPRAADATINCPATDWQPPTRVVRLKGQYLVVGKGRKQKRVQKTRTIMWKPQIPMDEWEEHFWCPYCRRPTVFRQFEVHHNLPIRRTGGPISPEVIRCIICGASERVVNLRKPQLHQRWDSTTVR